MSNTFRRILAPLASLKLTVALFAMSAFLVFAGTLAQIDSGLWTVVRDYFRGFIAWIELRIFFPRAWNVRGGFYFPGGWLLGATLLVNLVAAHVVRFRVRAHGSRLVLGLLVLAAGAVLTGLILAGVFTKDVAATQDDAFWRVLLRLAKGEIAALALLTGCLLAFKQRGGIVLTHAGIILMLLSELFTALWAVEGQMRIEEGSFSNYLYHTRAVELAIIDPADPKFDAVAVVPGALLAREKHIRDDKLPVDIDVVQYMPNSRLSDGPKAPAKTKNPATAGFGLRTVAAEQPEASGTDPNQTVDSPSAYLTFKKKGTHQSLGTYLVSLWFRADRAQTLTVGDKRYTIALRFKRTYKPYTVHLIDFRHDLYLGTNKPKNYSSEVRLVDPEHHVDRKVKIWMNNPLRYRGETFYQSSFEPGDRVTILQVVDNAGWMVPYVACMIVGTGLAAHFAVGLLGFLRRRALA